jgi:aryl-alcohol dehydrogenase-like predicted oxidoreductase
MHHVDRDAPWDEIWQAMEQVVQQGRSSTSAQQLRRLADRAGERHAAARHFLGSFRTEPLQPERAHHRAGGDSPAARTGSGDPWSPLAGGLLRRRRGRRTARERPAAEERREVRAQLEAYAALCREIGSRRRTSRSRGCSTPRPSRRRSSVRARWTS